jgi:flagellar motor switch/type III secretory pathway protein FliN
VTPHQRLRAGAAQPWLPPSAFDSGLGELSLASALVSWATAWFSAARPSITGALRPWTGQPGEWKTCGEGVAFGFAPEGRLGLAGQLLGFKPSETAKLNASDRRLADELAWQCAVDLGDAIAAASGLGRKHCWLPASDADLVETYSASVGPRQGETWLRVAIDRALLVHIIRAAGPVDGPLPPLSSLEDGIEIQPVVVSALVGRCQVTLGDLTSLEQGDVLCLDGFTDEPVALAIEHAASTAACRIEQDGGVLRLRIIE